MGAKNKDKLAKKRLEGKEKKDKDAKETQSAVSPAVSSSVPPPLPYMSDMTPEQIQQELEAQKRREKIALKEKQKADKVRQEKEEEERKAKQLAREARSWETKTVAAVKKNKYIEKAVVSDDGTWYVCANVVENEWIEAAGDYYCTLCRKHLNNHTFEDHCNSQTHKNKEYWQKEQEMTEGIAQNSYVEAASAGPQTSNIPQAEQQIVQYDQVSAQQRIDVEIAGYPKWWVKRDFSDWGYVDFCLACEKQIDDSHLTSEKHHSRVEAFEFNSSEFVSPDEEWIMFVPWDQNTMPETQDELSKKCLLCSKFINDDASHATSGHGMSKEHAKRLNNYQYYKEQVKEERKSIIAQYPLCRKIVERRKFPSQPYMPGFEEKMTKMHSRASAVPTEKSTTSGATSSAPRPPVKGWNPPHSSAASVQPTQQQNVATPTWPGLSSPQQLSPSPMAEEPTQFRQPQFEQREATYFQSPPLQQQQLLQQQQQQQQKQQQQQEQFYQSTRHHVPQRQEFVEGCVYKCIEDYDGLEKLSSGEIQGGYLSLRKGLAYTLMSQPSEGEPTNRYDEYGYFQPCSEQELTAPISEAAWAPTHCFDLNPVF